MKPRDKRRRRTRLAHSSFVAAVGALLASAAHAATAPEKYQYHGHHRTWPNWQPDPSDLSCIDSSTRNRFRDESCGFDERQRRAVPSHTPAPRYPDSWNATLRTVRRVNGRLASNETWQLWVNAAQNVTVSRLERCTQCKGPGGGGGAAAFTPITHVQYFAGATATERAGRTYVLATCVRRATRFPIQPRVVAQLE